MQVRTACWVFTLMLFLCTAFGTNAAAQTDGPVTVSLSCDKTDVKTGDTVNFTAVVTSRASGGSTTELLFCTATYQDPSTGRELAAASNPVELVRSGWVVAELPLRIALGPLLSPVVSSFTVDGVGVPAQVADSGEAVVVVPGLACGQSRVVQWQCIVR
ncbi:MAG: hypothetical protein ACUVTZ_14520 [Armatimonadota bacterium]